MALQTPHPPAPSKTHVHTSSAQRGQASRHDGTEWGFHALHTPSLLPPSSLLVPASCLLPLSTEPLVAPDSSKEGLRTQGIQKLRERSTCSPPASSGPKLVSFWGGPGRTPGRVGPRGPPAHSPSLRSCQRARNRGHRPTESESTNPLSLTLLW